jgi:hypothetical protein
MFGNIQSRNICLLFLRIGTQKLEYSRLKFCPWFPMDVILDVKGAIWTGGVSEEGAEKVLWI